MSDKKSGDEGEQGIDPRVAKRRQDALGRGLQSLYDNVVAQPVPDEFLNILKDVDDRTTTNKSKPNGADGGKG